ncbi:MAG: hypothetical protein AAB740_04775 [Patescibacteria group bacterium]
MDSVIAKNSILRNLIQAAGGMVVLPLKKWKNIEADLEDLEMYRSANFAKEITSRRKETKTLPLTELLRKHKI